MLNAQTNKERQIMPSDLQSLEDQAALMSIFSESPSFAEAGNSTSQFLLRQPRPPLPRSIRAINSQFPAASPAAARAAKQNRQVEKCRGVRTQLP
jgi:hypothetical protein